MTKDFKKTGIILRTYKNMQNTIPHPAPEEICGSHGSHPVRDSKKKSRMGTDKTDKVWSVEKTLRF